MDYYREERKKDNQNQFGDDSFGGFYYKFTSCFDQFVEISTNQLKRFCFVFLTPKKVFLSYSFAFVFCSSETDST